jgi:hypothetical protein
MFKLAMAIFLLWRKGKQINAPAQEKLLHNFRLKNHNAEKIILFFERKT